ncbi:hypothetical protein NTG1052_770004 [Candidatus Nitrotoga sp. 1052]|nr:hypothetical protein NTG1052_770004 [Candidatus Nitrotoga sp. 1052]
MRKAYAIERRHFDGHHHFSTEFLRLNISASGERLTGDTSRETELIFDSRARARLTAERMSVEHKHGMSPSDAAYTAQARPAEPAPMIATS